VSPPSGATQLSSCSVSASALPVDVGESAWRLAAAAAQAAAGCWFVSLVHSCQPVLLHRVLLMPQGQFVIEKTCTTHSSLRLMLL
jgi:hypothetical protein